MTKTVLIVDDDTSICDLFSMKFGKFPNLEIHTANSGNDGISLAKKLNPDLLILDIMMPDMDGDDVYETLKDQSALSGKTKVVFLSSLIDSESGNELSGNKFGYWMLSKQLSVDKIVERAMTLINR